MAVNWKLVDATAQKYGIPRSLFRRLVRQESGGNQGARSPAGAIGLTQLLPGTAREVGANPYTPAGNLTGGARYLSKQYRDFGNRWDLALSAYNSGPGGSEGSGRVEGFPETQAYVRAILSGLPPGAASPSPVAGSGPQEAAQTPPGMSPALASIFNQNQELLGVPGLPLELLSRRAAAPRSMAPVSSGGGTRGRNPRLPRGRGLPFLTRFVQPHGLTVTSTTGGKHVKSSWHYKKRGLDAAGTPEQMLAAAKAALKNPKRFKEMFYDPLGFYIKNGRVYKGAIGGHSDHIHIAS
jgi:hypothetical protein